MEGPKLPYWINACGPTMSTGRTPPRCRHYTSRADDRKGPTISSKPLNCSPQSAPPRNCLWPRSTTKCHPSPDIYTEPKFFRARTRWRQRRPPRPPPSPPPPGRRWGSPSSPQLLAKGRPEAQPWAPPLLHRVPPRGKLRTLLLPLPSSPPARSPSAASSCRFPCPRRQCPAPTTAIQARSHAARRCPPHALGPSRNAPAEPSPHPQHVAAPSRRTPARASPCPSRRVEWTCQRPPPPPRRPRPAAAP